MQFNYKHNLLRKLFNYLLRKVLFINRKKFHQQDLPQYIGLLHEYISIDIMVDGIYDIKSINEILKLLKKYLEDYKIQLLIVIIILIISYYYKYPGILLFILLYILFKNLKEFMHLKIIV